MKVNLSGEPELTEKQLSLIDLYNNLSKDAKQAVMNIKLPGQVPVKKTDTSVVVAPVETATDRVKKILTWGSLGLLVYKFLRL